MRGIRRLFSPIRRRGIFGLVALLMLSSQLFFVAPVFAADSTLGGKITGGDNSQPIPSATVDVLDTSSGSVVATDDADTNGDYSITVVEGTYNVRVTPPTNSGYQVSTVNNVDLSINQTLNFILVPAQQVNRTYSGTLKDQNGNPLPSARVQLSGGGGSALTDSTGAFSITAPQGQYSLDVEPQFLSSKIKGSTPVIDLTNDLTNQEVVVNLSRLNVQVLDPDGNPIEGAFVLANQTGTGTNLLPGYQTSYEGEGFAHSDANGIASVPLATGALVTEISVSEVEGFSPVELDNLNITLNGNTSYEIQLPDPNNRTYSGTLKDQNGNPLPSTRIRLAGENGGGSAFTDSSGAFSVVAPQGQYSLTVDPSLFNTSIRGLTQVIDLTNDLTDQEVVASLATLNVRVLGPDGNPLEGAEVFAEQTGTGVNLLSGYQAQYEGGNQASSDVNGIASIGKLAVGAQVNEISVSVPGYPLLDLDNLNITLSESTTYEVQLPDPNNRTYSGTLKDQNGNPLPPGARISIRNQNGNGFSTIPDNAGAFSFTVPQGQYSLSVEPQFLASKITGNTPVIDLTTNLTNQEVIANLSRLTVQILNLDGNPVEDAQVLASQTGTGVNLLPGYQTSYEGEGFANSDANGIASVSLATGAQVNQISIEAQGFLPLELSNVGITLSEDTTIVVQLQEPVPPELAPELSATSPTNTAANLNWDAVLAATSYKIFRDGVEIDTTNNTSFTDSSLVVNGSYDYTASSCNQFGCSDQSDPVAVVYDTEAPTLGAPSWSANPQTEGPDTTLTVPASDTLSGVAQGEYFIGSDPGEGNATSMNWDGTNLTATFGASLAPGTYTVGMRAQDNAGNWSEVTTDELVIEPLDTTPPEITYTLDPELPSSGWFNSPVTLSWSVTDPESEVTNQTGCNETMLSSDTAGTDYTCSATSTGGTAMETVTLKLDQAAPTIDYELSAGSNVNGWYNAPVTITFTCNDALSGVQECPEPITLGDSGADQTVLGTVTDEAGNTTSVTTEPINIDLTAPDISYEIAPAPNANGWNNNDVIVTFTCNDALSGVQTCTDPVTLADEGAGQTVTGTATDNAGNTASVDVTLNIDKTAPTITYTLDPSPNAAGWSNTDTTVTFNCQDSISGVESCTNPSVVTTEGDNNQVTGTVTDQAGNTATTTATVKLDKTNPTISTPTMSGIVLGILLGSTTNISATVGDNLSGVVRAEYYFDTDPGQGNGTAMNLSANPTTNGIATATANVSGLGGGQHTLYVRSQDDAGNWSVLATRTFLKLF